jgi:transcriptional regulator with XRE-family HTH domain
MIETAEKGPPQNGRAKRICEARVESRLSDAQIADKIGVARTSVLNWQVRGSINLDNLRDFADMMGVSFHWLAFGEGPKTITPFILNELRTAFPSAEWSTEHAELLRVVFQKTNDGTLDEDYLRNFNNVIEGLTYPAFQRATEPTEEMINSAARAAPYLNRDAVRDVVSAALKR